MLSLRSVSIALMTARSPLYRKLFGAHQIATVLNVLQARAGKSMSHDTGENSRDIVSKKIEVDGMNLSYDVTGVGKHNLFLFPGALGCVKTDFKYQMENMDHDFFTLFGWDPPGYGRSIPPNRTWPEHFLSRDADIAAMTMKVALKLYTSDNKLPCIKLTVTGKLDCICGLLKRLSQYNLIRDAPSIGLYKSESEAIGVGKSSLLGWSDGGITALMVAARYPEMVNKLVVWGAAAFVLDEEIPVYEKIRNIDSWSSGMRTTFLNVYKEDYLRKEFSNWVDAYKRYWTERKGDICLDELVNITCPTLILHGAKDPLVPNAHPEFLAKKIKNSQLHVYPDGKHNIHQRYFMEFNSTVQAFLTKPE